MTGGGGGGLAETWGLRVWVPGIQFQCMSSGSHQVPVAKGSPKISPYPQGLPEIASLHILFERVRVLDTISLTVLVNSLGKFPYTVRVWKHCSHAPLSLTPPKLCTRPEVTHALGHIMKNAWLSDSEQRFSAPLLEVSPLEGSWVLRSRVLEVP